MDFFNEWIVKRKRSIKDILLITAIVIAAVLLSFTLFMLGGYLGSFTLLFIAGVIYLAYILISNTSIEFEYIMTNGELDIDKISAKKRRKRVISVRAKDFEYFAPFTQEHSSAYNDNNIAKRIDATSNTGSERMYFAIFYNNSQKTCLIFEPTDRMLEDISRYAPRSLNFSR